MELKTKGPVKSRKKEAKLITTKTTLFSKSQRVYLALSYHLFLLKMRLVDRQPCPVEASTYVALE